MKLPGTGWMIRIAVVLTIAGLLLLVPILVTVSALAVGAFMLGSLILTTSMVIYLIAVVRELRRREAL